ncbi:gp53 [Mycobacterium phage Predator]|uniref:Uncharacterized protein n=1 Tax=Mycobacterium phage Predator TaxID=543153 RepID=B3VM80_9CAUD|nr:gp53 [Mycobacterium phage Predator]ACF05150.1 hypothetical protein PREDATOR_53 [Mycobacterium phage Predator]
MSGDTQNKTWQYVKASDIVTGDVTRRGEIAATIVSLSPGTRTLAFVGGAPKLTISDHAPIEVLR